MAGKAVLGQGRQHVPRAALNARAGDMAELLPRIVVHLARADIEAAVREADSAVGKQGQQGGVVVLLIGRVRRKGVGGSGKGRHGNLVACHNIAALRIKAHGAPSGQEKQFAFLRQGHELVGAGQPPFPAAPTDHQQIGVVENVALGVGHDHMGNYGMSHAASPCSMRVERI